MSKPSRIPRLSELPPEPGRLSPSEQLALWHEATVRGDRRAEARLVAFFRPGILRRAERRAAWAGHIGVAVDAEELFAAGMLGLIQALRGYNPRMERPLLTDVQNRAHRQIDEALADHLVPLFPPPYSLQSVLFHVAARRVERGLDGEPLSAADRARLARLVAETRERRLGPDHLRRAKHPRPAALSVAEADALCRVRVMPLTPALPEAAPTLDERVIDRITRERLRERLGRLLAELPERHAEILCARYLADEPATLETLAHRDGVSVPRIMQIERAAIAALRRRATRLKP